MAGVYNGLFYPTNGVTEASSGFISATIASNSAGAYTAKLLLDGGSNSFSGSFDLTGIARTNLARSGKTPVSVTLILDLNPADALMGGSVSNAAAGWNSVILADRAVFSAIANPATNYAGQFTLLLPPDTNAPAGKPGRLRLRRHHQHPGRNFHPGRSTGRRHALPLVGADCRKRRRPALSIPLFGQGKFAGMDLLYQRAAAERVRRQFGQLDQADRSQYACIRPVSPTS